MDKTLIATSKFLSQILRHRPELIGVELDAEGWLDVATLIDAASDHGHSLTLERVHAVVVENDKQRFALSEDGLRIRANQGHSIRTVDIALQAVEPPPLLYHGTVSRFIAGIHKCGLLKRSRNHVHLSADVETARKVGQRRGEPIVLSIDAAAMYDAGQTFYFSKNGVWLTDAVPAEFIVFPDC